MSSTGTLTYTHTAKIFHWLIALAIILMLALGWCLDLFPKGEARFAAIQLHKSLGITILLLSLCRLLWRWLHHAPPLPRDMPRWQQRAAHIGHVFLYTMMIAMPLSGWIMVSTSAYNIPTILYGVLPWPSFPVAAEDKTAVNHLTGSLHAAGAYIIAALAGGHIAVALQHHFIARDDILLRMAPRGTTGFLNRLRGQT